MNWKKYCLAFSVILFSLWGCNIPQITLKNENKTVPAQFTGAITQQNKPDTVNMAMLNWRSYFADTNLIALIDTALKNNQELNVMMQEIALRNNEVLARSGAYMPSVKGGIGASAEKAGRYTRNGAVEEQLEIKEGERFPEPMRDFSVGLMASWEIDIWNKLHNAEKSAMMQYLAGMEGRNFLITRLIAEIANSYYELMALDNMLDIIEKNIQIQSNALHVVEQQKEYAKVTQLAVNRFQAQLLNTQNRQFAIKQKIVETENRINFLTARFPQPVKRNSAKFLEFAMDSMQIGIPSQLLANRPDIRQAELELAAANINIDVAKAEFYPSITIRSGIGFQAFNPSLLVNPASLLYNLAGDIMAPLINRNAIEAEYKSAGARQIQAVYNYEQTILNGFVDVLNQMSKMDNYTQSYQTKNKEVEILNQSVAIAGNLFNSARADYAEVLLTQREALEARMEIVETKLKQFDARVNIYRALGGGWR
jgi:NodT family efflux transporter outer membrane factor (OMF) lipoprotein